MPKRQFTFSPPVYLILTNLPTIRKILKELDDEGNRTVTTEIEQYLRHLEVRLREQIPALKTWQAEFETTELYLFPGRDWGVVRDDHVAVCVSLAQCVKPSFYDEQDDPFVGLYVPDWKKHGKSFKSRLKGVHISGFEHISDYEGSDLEEEYYPLWSTVYLTPLVRRSELNLDGLEKAIVNRVRRLVSCEKKITQLISAVRQRK